MAVAPLLLNSTIKEDNSFLVADLTNPELYENEAIVIPKDTIHIFRSALLWESVCHSHFRVINFGSAPIEISLVLAYAADFSDIFEVRRVERRENGQRLEDEKKRSRSCLQLYGAGWRHPSHTP